MKNTLSVAGYTVEPQDNPYRCKLSSKDEARTFIIPEGFFTKTEFSEANRIPNYGRTYYQLQIMVKAGVLSRSPRPDRERGVHYSRTV